MTNPPETNDEFDEDRGWDIVREVLKRQPREMSQLVGLCSAARPSRAWAKIAKINFNRDVNSVLAGVRKALARGIPDDVAVLWFAPGDEPEIVELRGATHWSGRSTQWGWCPSAAYDGGTFRTRKLMRAAKLARAAREEEVDAVFDFAFVQAATALCADAVCSKLDSARALGRRNSRHVVVGIPDQGEGLLLGAFGSGGWVCAPEVPWPHEREPEFVSVPGPVPGKAAQLLSDLSHPDAGRRGGASYALGSAKAGDGFVVSELVAGLRHGGDNARLWAAVALGQLAPKDDAVLAPLCDALRDPSTHVRQSAAGALAAIGDSRAVGAIEHALRHGDSYLRKKIMQRLAEFGDAAVLRLVGLGLDDPDDRVRLGAIRNCAGLDAAGAPLVSRLRTIATSAASKFERQEAEFALEEIDKALRGSTPQ